MSGKKTEFRIDQRKNGSDVVLSADLQDSIQVIIRVYPWNYVMPVSFIKSRCELTAVSSYNRSQTSKLFLEILNDLIPCSAA